MSSSSHQFQERTFTKLTYCDYCTKLLWGVAKQGVTCEGCHYNCHKKCSELVYNNCIRSMFIPSGDDYSQHSSATTTTSSSPKSVLPPRRANTDGMRVSIPPAIVSSSQPLQSLVERPSKKKDQDYDKDTKDTTPPAAGRTKFLEDAIISAAIRMSLPGDISALPKNDHPALSIQATTINFTRFVHKTTGLFWFQDQIEDIMTWKDPWNTSFVLVLYCFVCIYPVLLFLLPQCIMAAIMIYFFQQKSARQQQKILGIKNNAVQQQQQQQQQPARHISAEEAYIAAQEKAHHNRHHVYHDEDYLEQASSSDSEEEERRSTNVKYLSNLQHIQNMMGDVSDAHDAILPLFKHLDWSDEAEAIMIVQGTMAAFVGMSLVMWFIPWRWVFMIGGASGMLANSPWGKVVVKEGTSLAKDVAAWGQVQAQEMKKNHKQAAH
ncbi:MAG: integral peroxisomal membrane peroxin-domain-containing protein [Linnemannia gamsii]|nr:MAG: integral peroxisomal membrane peroxin-domain-containing protein [Linnemannia gamsii]